LHCPACILCLNTTPWSHMSGTLHASIKSPTSMKSQLSDHGSSYNSDRTFLACPAVSISWSTLTCTLLSAGAPAICSEACEYVCGAASQHSKADVMLFGTFVNTTASCKCMALVEERFLSLCSGGMQTDRYMDMQEKMTRTHPLV